MLPARYARSSLKFDAWAPLQAFVQFSGRPDFLDNWGTYHQQTPMLTVEVQNNAPDTPPRLQIRLTEVAIRETVAAALDWAQDSGAPRR